MPSILVIDNDPDFSDELCEQLRQDGYQVTWIGDAEDGLRRLEKESFDLLLLDNGMPRMTGLELLRALKERGRQVRVILMTGAYGAHTVIEAIASGASYFTKPLDYAELLPKLQPHLLKALSVPSATAPSSPPLKEDKEEDCLIVGPSEAMHDVLLRIGLLAAVDESVLILGETGTGKGAVARALHQHTRRAAGPFMQVDCANLSELLLESELFGHEKGAFTGAYERHIGKFEQCAGGTLFLDEIGEISLTSQSKLLGVLQDHRFHRMKGKETLQADVRVIAATNVDLETAVEAKQFRRDLFYRLNVFTIHLPPLRMRGEDLSLLVEHFVPRYSRKLGRDVRAVAPETMDVLRRYSWPGNIRELQSVIKKALLQAHGTMLLPEFLPPLPSPSPNPGSSATPPEAATDKTEGPIEPLRSVIAWAWQNHGDKKPYPLLLELLERELLRHALSQPHTSEKELADRIGIVKNTLRKWKEDRTADESR
jgi:DNA-binding NtrC family response regulator